MKSSLIGTRVISLMSGEPETQLRELLTRLGVHLDFARDTAEVSSMTQCSRPYEVAIVPSDPPSGEWLGLCHQLTAIKPSPSILISCKKDTFAAWAQALDSGGFGVIIEPYTYEELHAAIQGAVDDFHRRPGGMAQLPRRDQNGL